MWIRKFLSKFPILRKAAPFFSLLIMILVLSILSPYFLSVNNLFAIALQMSVVAILAIGQMKVIISGGIDLSVGSVLALAGVVTTMLIMKGLSLALSITAGLFVGASFGLIIGLLVASGHLPPFIATLGIMGIARGAALLLTGGVPVFGLPDGFNFLGGGKVAGIIPVPVIFTIILALLGHFILTHLPFGRYIYAVGSNMTAARLSGIPVKKTLIRVYVINGVLTAFAGIILASRLNTGQPTAGTGYELDVIAACVIGGASLSGGQGTIMGALIGALIMGVLRNGCNLLDISAFWQQIAIGTIIIVAVLSDQVRKFNSKH